MIQIAGRSRIDFFLMFLDENFLDMIALQMSIYSKKKMIQQAGVKQNKIGSWKNLNIGELKDFFRIFATYGNYSITSTRRLWEDTLSIFTNTAMLTLFFWGRVK